MSDSEKDTSGVDQLPSGRWRIRWRDGGKRKSKVFDSVGRIEQQQYQALSVPDDPLVTHAKKLLTEVLQGHEIHQEALDALLAEAMPHYPSECMNALRAGSWKLRRVIELAGVVIGSVGIGEARRG